MCSSLVVINHLQKIVMIILAWWERGLGERAHAGIGAHIGLDRELSALNCSVDMVHFHFVLLACNRILLFIFEARRALWAPRSVGPYGLGRAPSPLMHAPTGGMHMGAPKGHPL